MGCHRSRDQRVAFDSAFEIGGGGAQDLVWGGGLSGVDSLGKMRPFILRISLPELRAGDSVRSASNPRIHPAQKIGKVVREGVAIYRATVARIDEKGFDRGQKRCMGREGVHERWENIDTGIRCERAFGHLQVGAAQNPQAGEFSESGKGRLWQIEIRRVGCPPTGGEPGEVAHGGKQAAGHGTVRGRSWIARSQVVAGQKSRIPMQAKGEGIVLLDQAPGHRRGKSLDFGALRV